MKEEALLIRPVRNSETGNFRQCLLKWFLTHYLGFLSEHINPNFWLGGLVHHCLSAWYLGETTDPAHMFYELGRESIAQERGAQIVIDGQDLDYNRVEELEAYLDLGTEMLAGWQEWDKENRDFDVLASELAYYLEMATNDGSPFTFVARFDLLAENSDGIWVPDFKTAKDFRAEKNIEMDQQFRRYPFLVTQAHPEWADDVRGSIWLALKKMSPVTNPRSKPPYFARRNVDLTASELTSAGEELVAEVTRMLALEAALDSGQDPRELIYPSPTFDCTWKCDFYRNGLCALWRSGSDVKAAGENYGSWDNDHYSEYKEDHVASINTTARREGGDG